MIRKILIGLAVLFIVIQFLRPEKNLSNDQTFDISKVYPVPENVKKTLEVACNDCHSNRTKYPWYAEIQPSAWWLNGHVTDGKRHLNFSDFTRRRVAVQNHKFEEIVEVIDEHEMPLNSYTWLGMHQEAILTDVQRQELVDWATEQMAALKAKYPADSLIMKRK